MTTHLLSRTDRRPGPHITLHAQITLAQGRVHECTGAARRTFALWLARQVTQQKPGPVIWIAPAWSPDQLHPDGMANFVDPGRFLFVHPRRAPDLLWSTEESLRAGAVALVIADLPGIPALTPVRRLQLAAETGAEQGMPTLGLLLTPEESGTRGVDTRWHMAPKHTDTQHRWRLERRRARTLPPKAWTVTQAHPGAGLMLSKPVPGSQDGAALPQAAETAIPDT